MNPLCRRPFDLGPSDNGSPNRTWMKEWAKATALIRSVHIPLWAESPRKPAVSAVHPALNPAAVGSAFFELPLASCAAAGQNAERYCPDARGSSISTYHQSSQWWLPKDNGKFYRRYRSSNPSFRLHLLKTRLHYTPRAGRYQQLFYQKIRWHNIRADSSQMGTASLKSAYFTNPAACFTITSASFFGPRARRQKSAHFCRKLSTGFSHHLSTYPPSYPQNPQKR